MKLEDGISMCESAPALNCCEFAEISSPAQASPVIAVSIDRFSSLCAAFGHSIGDILADEIERRILSAGVAFHRFFRLHEEIFLGLLPSGTGRDQAEMMAERLRARIATPFQLPEREVLVTASLGVGWGAEGLRMVDLALAAKQRSKRAGGNTVTVYSASEAAQGGEQLVLAAQLRHAIDEEQLHLAYQPKMRLADGSLAGAEALLRWNHPRIGSIPPSVFIPAADYAGLTDDLGHKVLDLVGAGCRRWAGRGWRDQAAIAINVSPLQLSRPGFLPAVARFAETVGPQAIIIEITENAVLGEDEGIERTIHAIKGLGFRISMDDFGTGYSGLATLHRLPFDEIKLDRSFVRNLPQQRSSRAVVDAVVAMGRDMNLSVVAEGIETAEQLDCLREAGVELGQGFFLHKPMSEQDLLALARSLTPDFSQS